MVAPVLQHWLCVEVCVITVDSTSAAFAPAQDTHRLTGLLLKEIVQ